MKFNKKIFFRWAKVIAFFYAAIGIALFYFQDKILFHPKKLPTNYEYNFKNKFKEINIPFNEIDTLNLIKFLPENNRKGIVIYYHGNMKNVEHYANFARPFIKLGYEVWMEDYPSFGKSTGTITEKKLYEQAMEVKKMAEGIVGNDSIILYGKSLGTGIAAYVASHSKAKMLFLETPYYSIPSLFSVYAFIYPTKAMCNYKLPTNEFLKNVQYPIIILHGTNDGVIPYSEAKKLKPLLKKNDAFITVEGASHLTVNTSDIYFKTIDSLLK